MTLYHIQILFIAVKRGNIQSYETLMSFGEENGNKMKSYDNNKSRGEWKQVIIIIIIIIII
jgi:hypothetical protein